MYLNDNIVSTYNGPTMWPSDDINPTEKDMDWHAMAGQAILSEYFKNRTLIGYDELDMVRENRFYGNGEQSVQRYKDQLTQKVSDSSGTSKVPANTSESARKGYLNVDWKIFSPAPQIKDYVIGLLEDVDYAVEAHSLSPQAGAQREEMKWRAWLRSKTEDINKMMKAAGSNRGASKGFVPTSIEELELWESMGGVKLAQEMASETLIDHSFTISDWHEIHKKLISDAVDNKIVAVKDEMDPITGKVYSRWVDIENGIFPKRETTGFKGYPYAGEIILKTIQEIRVEAQECGQGFTEKQLSTIARSSLNYFNNPGGKWSQFSSFDPKTGGYRYDSFMVPVFDFEYLSIDKEFKRYRKNKKGESHYYRSRFGEQVNTENEKTVVKSRETYYGGKLILCAEKNHYNLVYQFGPLRDQKRPNKTRAVGSYHVLSVPGKSITDRAKPIYDQIQLNYLKYQDALAKAAPKGLLIEMGSVAGIKLSGMEVEPYELVNRYRQSGTMVYRFDMKMGHGAVMNQKPIEELPGGVGPQLQEFFQVLEVEMIKLRDIVGIKQTDGVKAPKVGLGISEMQEAQTNTMLRPIVSTLKKLKSEAAHGMLFRLQIALKHNKDVYDGYYPVVGASMLESIKITADISAENFGLKLIAKPNQQEQLDLMQKVEYMSAPGKNGEPGISASEVIIVKNALYRGNIKLAQRYLVLADNRRQKRVEEARIQGAQVIRDKELAVNAQKAQIQEQELWTKAKIEEFHKQKEFERQVQLEKIKNQNTKEEMTHEATVESQTGSNVSVNS